MSPKPQHRQATSPLTRSSLTTVDTEEGSMHMPCHRGITGTPVRWAMMAPATPKWQKNTSVSGWLSLQR